MNLHGTNHQYSSLKDLVSCLNDGKTVYEKATEKSRDIQQRMYFNYLLHQRAGFAKTLNALLVTLGEQPQPSGTFKGKLFNQWLDVKTAFSGTEVDSDSLIAYCLFFEKRIQQAYREVLSTIKFSPEQNLLLTIQQQSLQLAYKKLQKLKLYSKTGPDLRFL